MASALSVDLRRRVVGAIEGGLSCRAARETLTFSLADEDDPDPVIDGRIELGALTAEFFALGLDPYPRKPGVEFVAPAESARSDSPFAALAARPAKRERRSNGKIEE